MLGLSGNDLFDGGKGDDTYVFNLGDGQDTIYGENPNSEFDRLGADTILFGEGIGPDNVRFSNSGQDLAITIAGTTDKIILDFPLIVNFGYPVKGSSSRPGPPWIYRKDFSCQELRTRILSMEQPIWISWWGEVGMICCGVVRGMMSTYSTGATAGTQLPGENTYVSNSPNGVDKIVMGAGITRGGVVLSRRFWDDLVINIGGTGDQITLLNFTSSQ